MMGARCTRLWGVTGRTCSVSMMYMATSGSGAATCIARMTRMPLVEGMDSGMCQVPAIACPAAVASSASRSTRARRAVAGINRATALWTAACAVLHLATGGAFVLAGPGVGPRSRGPELPVDRLQQPVEQRGRRLTMLGVDRPQPPGKRSFQLETGLPGPV